MFARLFAPLLLTLALAVPAAASPEADASAFVETGVERGIAILTETGPGDPARFARFRDFVNEVIDTRSVALFVLGPYRRTASEADIAAYLESFRAYATANYESRMGAYGGQTIRVTDATARSDTDVLVKGEIVNAAGEPVADIAFRILETPRGLRLFDVQVAGIWLAVEQRNQFSSYLAQHGGSLRALIDHLNAETAALRDGSSDVAAVEG